MRKKRIPDKACDLKEKVSKYTRIPTTLPKRKDRVGIDTIVLCVDTRVDCKITDSNKKYMSYYNSSFHGNRWQARTYKGYLIVRIDSDKPYRSMNVETLRHRICSILSLLNVSYKEWGKIHVCRLDIAYDTIKESDIPNSNLSDFDKRKKMRYNKYWGHTSNTVYINNKSECYAYYHKHIELRDKFSINIPPLFRKEHRILKTRKTRQLHLSLLSEVFHRLHSEIKSVRTCNNNTPQSKILTSFIQEVSITNVLHYSTFSIRTYLISIQEVLNMRYTRIITLYIVFQSDL